MKWESAGGDSSSSRRRRRRRRWNPRGGAVEGRRTQGRTQIGERGDASPLVVLTTETTPAFPTATVHARRRTGETR